MDSLDGQLSDRELMLVFAKDGDEPSFAELVRRWDDRLLHFLTRAAGDFEAAKDLRQEVFVRVYQYAGTFNGQNAFSTWLFRIALNRLYSWRELARRRRALGLKCDADGPGNGTGFGASPEEAVQREEFEAAVRQELERLGNSERELLLLRFQQGLSYREIASVLSIPESTVKSRVYTTLHRLREPLAAHRETMRSLE